MSILAGLCVIIPAVISFAMIRLIMDGRIRAESARGPAILAALIMVGGALAGIMIDPAGAGFGAFAVAVMALVIGLVSVSKAARGDVGRPISPEEARRLLGMDDSAPTDEPLTSSDER